MFWTCRGLSLLNEMANSTPNHPTSNCSLSQPRATKSSRTKIITAKLEVVMVKLSSCFLSIKLCVLGCTLVLDKVRLLLLGQRITLTIRSPFSDGIFLEELRAEMWPLMPLTHEWWMCDLNQQHSWFMCSYHSLFNHHRDTTRDISNEGPMNLHTYEMTDGRN